jgi:hypothetical protein
LVFLLVGQRLEKPIFPSLMALSRVSMKSAKKRELVINHYPFCTVGGQQNIHHFGRGRAEREREKKKRKSASKFRETLRILHIL